MQAKKTLKIITDICYRGAAGILVVYDITDLESFNNLNSWLIEIEKNENKNVYKVIIRNKCDLEKKRQASYEQGKEFADTYGIEFIETSAKTNQNVGEAFVLMTKEMISRTQEKETALNKNEGNKKDGNKFYLKKSKKIKQFRIKKSKI